MRLLQAARRLTLPTVARRLAPRVLPQLVPRSFSTIAPMGTPMFCRQCEQTQDHFGCTNVGVCGKSSETAACQDALMDVIKSVSHWCVQARKENVDPSKLDTANLWTLQAAFSTLTNVNFSDERIAEFVRQGLKIRDELKAVCSETPASKVAHTQVPTDTIGIEEFGHSVSIPLRQAEMNHADAFALNELATYGLKGVCAYAAHCANLGVMDEMVMKDVHEKWAKISDSAPDMTGLLQTCLDIGALNAKVLALLDGAHADHFGAPEPSQVRITVKEGPAILVSGHDMADLHQLLEQCKGRGINVYTHGEMLPAHGYPKLKAYDELAGNYGTAWQNQKFEFASFPGPVVVTTNCILEPRKKYKGRLYTTNETGVDGVKHIQKQDFTEVIEQALSMKGFEKSVEPEQFIMTGFNHRAVLPLANQVIDAAKSGALSRIFLIGGCDGSQFERNYFTELAEETPDNSLILTLGCAKNRVIHSEKLLGATLSNGLPRVLDMGQCNDSYSAVVVALELAKALNCTVNDLPLSLAVSHLEQKAAAVLLTLLHLGVKNIRLGPSLPAYLTDNVVQVLSKEYNLMPTGDAKEDLAMMMEGK